MERPPPRLRTPSGPSAPLARAALALALAAALAGCRGGASLEQARQRGLDYFASQVDDVDPGWANLFGYLHRRFGLEVTNARGDALHRVPRSPLRPEMGAVYRRLVDPAAAVPPAAIAALESPIDRITASALHCDRIPLPGDWVEILGRASRHGAYALTHAALAGQWTLENGCLSIADLAALQRQQLDALVALVEDREALAARSEVATDVWIEAVAMLYYLGARERVRGEWIQALLGAQRSDGGWPRGPGAARSDPHPSALALWVVLENLQPDAAPIRWVPATRTG